MIRLLSGAVLAATLLLSSVASAGNGYACLIRRISTTTFGSAGAIYVQYYGAPACQGTYLGARYYCSANPTSGSCTSNNFYYTEGQLNTFMTAFQTAGLEGTKINFIDSTCIGGGSDCGAYFSMYPVP
jgi:hypothetical protein